MARKASGGAGRTARGGLKDVRMNLAVARDRVLSASRALQNYQLQMRNSPYIRNASARAAVANRQNQRLRELTKALQDAEVRRDEFMREESRLK